MSETTVFDIIDQERDVYRCRVCGYAPQFEADGPYENGWSCCPHCGASIQCDVDLRGG